MRRNILVITGTRAEYGSLKSVIDRVRQSKKLRLLLLVTGTHTLKKYGLTINEIRKDGVPISGVVKIKDNDSMLSALAKEIAGMNRFCLSKRPDAIVVLGDRDEAFAAATAGAHLGIPVAHLHGGDLTGTIVDGLLRNAITKLAHLHFTACKSGFERVRLMQENPKNVFLVGAPGLDDIHKQALPSRRVLAKKLKLNGARLWLLLVMHPAPFDLEPLQKQIDNPLSAIKKLTGYEKIVIYPNSDTGSKIFIQAIERFRKDKSFHIFPNLPRRDYLALLNKQIDFLIGNSSSGVVESGYFKLPTINIGDRQKGRERGGNVVDCSYETVSIGKAINKVKSAIFRSKMKKVASPYGYGRAAARIVKILEKIKPAELISSKTYN